MKSFGIDKIKLTDTIFSKRQFLVREYLLNFDTQRLMHTFRLNANIPSTAQPLGGWESPECELRGHFVGHFLSACAKYAFANNDAKIGDKANEIVDILDDCVFENGYLSAFPEKALDDLEENENRNVWAPYYTFHKIIAGLVDCGIYQNNSKAIVLAENLGIYIYNRFQKLSFWKIDGILRCTKVNPVNEFGGIGDALYSLWELCNNSKILELAKLFDRDYFIQPLSNDVDVLENLHANTHIPMILSVAHRYNITKQEEFKKATLNFYKFLLARTFANGNNSSRAEHYMKGGVSEKSEHWGSPEFKPEYITGGESESCCAHNSEKLLVRLLEWNDDVQYLHHLENLKYNAVLNCASNITGLSQYHQPMGKNQSKKFSSLYDDFWCCTGSGIEAIALLQDNIWFHSDDTVFINMFVASTASWEEKNINFNLVTDYPQNLVAKLTINTKEIAKISIAFKESSISNIRLNGEIFPLEHKSGFVIINASFSDNDEIEISIKSELIITQVHDMYYVKYGEILLARVAGENDDLSDIRKVNNYEFVGNDCKFLPLYMVQDEVYTVYINSHTTQKAIDGSSAYM